MSALAVDRAEAGSAAWRSAVHAQQAATPDHADFYGLASELVDTLATVASLARLLARQVADYPATVATAGEVVYDDSRFTADPVDPRERLDAAVVELARVAAWPRPGRRRARPTGSGQRSGTSASRTPAASRAPARRDRPRARGVQERAGVCR